jgi:hypothetical protein
MMEELKMAQKETLNEVLERIGIAAEFEARGKAIGEALGEARGEARGEAKGKYEIAKNALHAGLPDDVIRTITGLDMETIRSLH